RVLEFAATSAAHEAAHMTTCASLPSNVVDDLVGRWSCQGPSSLRNFEVPLAHGGQSERQKPDASYAYVIETISTNKSHDDPALVGVLSVDFEMTTPAMIAGPEVWSLLRIKYRREDLQE